MNNGPRTGSDRISSVDRRALLTTGAAAALSTVFPWNAEAQQTAQPTPTVRAAVAPAPGSGEPPVTGALSRYIASSPSATLPEEVRELGIAYGSVPA